MMRELIENSAFLGVVITIGSFELGRAIRKKWNFALFNPLLLAILFSIGVLLLVPYRLRKLSQRRKVHQLSAHPGDGMPCRAAL